MRALRPGRRRRLGRVSARPARGRRRGWVSIGSREGQATVEIVAFLPVLAVAGVAILQLLAAGIAQELAGHAAEAGAVAIAQDRDPVTAARESIPGWGRDRVQVRVRGSRVRVRLRPPAVMRRVAELLTATAQADAGAGAP